MSFFVESELVNACFGPLEHLKSVTAAYVPTFLCVATQPFPSKPAAAVETLFALKWSQCILNEHAL